MKLLGILEFIFFIDELKIKPYKCDLKWNRSQSLVSIEIIVSNHHKSASRTQTSEQEWNSATQVLSEMRTPWPLVWKSFYRCCYKPRKNKFWYIIDIYSAKARYKSISTIIQENSKKDRVNSLFILRLQVMQSGWLNIW